jgi:hypothetical protein
LMRAVISVRYLVIILAAWWSFGRCGESGRGQGEVGEPAPVRVRVCGRLGFDCGRIEGRRWFSRFFLDCKKAAAQIWLPCEWVWSELPSG